MRGEFVVLAVVVVAIVVIGGSIASTHNQLVAEREDIQARWAQVDTDMKRRADLIPNLVATVKGYAKQEQTVFGEIAAARSALINAHGKQEEIGANDQLSGALGRLLSLSESYPQLKSNENFLRLQDELERTENRIAVSRRDYNEAIRRYNTSVELFPNSMTASLFGFHRDNDYFKTTAEDRQTPQVSF